MAEKLPRCEVLAQRLPADDREAEYTPRAGLDTIRNLCGHGAHDRYLDNGQPKSVAAAWSALYATTEWLLDGTKANRTFSAATGGHLHPTKDNSKDSLNGREEAVLLVGDESDAKELSTKLKTRLEKDHLLKKGENLGAGTLIKRLWPYAVLCKLHAFEPMHLNMPNTRSIAAHEPSNDDKGEEGDGEKYFAVLALDGDSMGKWISGSKTPKLKDVLSTECAKVYRDKVADLDNRRPLSPSWHLQFAEALGNFSQHAARRIVEAFDGRLIYSPPEHLLQPHTWLAGGLATFGLGAKTAAGYGWFDTSKPVQDGVSSAFQRASLRPSPALLDEFLKWDDRQVRKAAAAFAFAALVPKTGRESTSEYRFTLATFILESRTALFLAQKTHAGSDFAKGVKRLAEEFQLSLP